MVQTQVECGLPLEHNVEVVSLAHFALALLRYRRIAERAAVYAVAWRAARILVHRKPLPLLRLHKLCHMSCSWTRLSLSLVKTHPPSSLRALRTTQLLCNSEP